MSMVVLIVRHAHMTDIFGRWSETRVETNSQPDTRSPWFPLFASMERRPTSASAEPGLQKDFRIIHKQRAARSERFCILHADKAADVSILGIVLVE